MFADRRLSLAVARGSGRAVSQLGSIAQQAGTAVSLHGWRLAHFRLGQQKNKLARPRILTDQIKPISQRSEFFHHVQCSYEQVGSMLKVVPLTLHFIRPLCAMKKIVPESVHD